MAEKRLRLKERFNLTRRDAWILLAALLLSFFFWLVHCLKYEYSVIVDVPVIAESSIEGKSNLSDAPSVVTARCRADGYKLVQLLRSDRKASVVRFNPSDLHHLDEDIYSISSNELALYVNDIFGDGVQLESFLSTTVKFRFPTVYSKKVPVQAVSTLSYQSQYMAVSGMVLSPDSVLVYGEPVRLENIDRVYTSQITHLNLKSSVHGSAKLEPVSGLRFSENQVNYSVEVSRYVEIQEEVKVLAKNVPAGKNLSILPSMAKVSFICAFPMAKDPSKVVEVYIDYKDFVSSRTGRCVARTTSLPSSVIKYHIEPEIFECVEGPDR